MKETAEDFMRRESPSRARARNRREETRCDARSPRKAGEVGLLGHDVPEEYGGLGGDKNQLEPESSRARAVSDLSRQLRRARRHRHDAAGLFGTPSKSATTCPAWPAASASPRTR